MITTATTAARRRYEPAVDHLHGNVELNEPRDHYDKRVEDLGGLREPTNNKMEQVISKLILLFTCEWHDECPQVEAEAEFVPFRWEVFFQVRFDHLYGNVELYDVWRHYDERVENLHERGEPMYARGCVCVWVSNSSVDGMSNYDSRWWQLDG